MVGLSVILENYKDLAANKTSTHQVISKGISMINPSSPTTTSPPSFYNNNNNNGTCFSRRNNSNNICTNFLEYCFLCKQKLLPAKDIYMYKGDKAFCSVECRCRQIFMDEEESTTSTTAAAKSGCTREYNSSPSSSRSGKGTRNRANNNAFAY